MNISTLNIILKLKEWEEEIEKQKFASILSDRRILEKYMKELQERFSSVDLLKEATSEEFLSIYTEIHYIVSQLNKTKLIMKQIDEEVEKQRQIYEEAFKERKKIAHLHNNLIISLKIEREKIEEKIISDVFMSRLRSE